MKKIVMGIISLVFALGAKGQDTDVQTATLQHGDKTTVFYGVDAFINAYNAAADTLDVITLSGGFFNRPSPISKSLAIYGNGMESDITNGSKLTWFDGALIITPKDKWDEDGNLIEAGIHVNGIHLEGLNINNSIIIRTNNNEPIHNLEIVKCYCRSICFEVDCYNCVIRQSHILQNIVGGSNGSSKIAKNLLVSNCYFEPSFFNFNTSSSTIKVDHCLLWSRYGVESGPHLYTNNILYNINMSTGSKSEGNIFITNTGNPSTDSDKNWYGVANAGLWAAEGEDGTYADAKDFAIKYPNKYIGTDGTQIGLHGGVYAWNKIPVIPRITECTIDSKDAADGILKVSLKAEAQTKE